MYVALVTVATPSAYSPDMTRWYETWLTAAPAVVTVESLLPPTAPSAEWADPTKSMLNGPEEPVPDSSTVRVFVSSRVTEWTSVYASPCPSGMYQSTSRRGTPVRPIGMAGLSRGS